MKIGVVIPSRGLIFADTIKSVVRNLNGYEYILEVVTNQTIPDCFNVGVTKVLSNDCTHLWLVEEDMLIPPNTLDELVSMDTDIALCDYPNKRTGKPFGKYVNNEFQYSGVGCLLVKTSVFSKMEFPYFRKALYQSEEDGTPKFVKFRDPGDGYGGHDVHFYQEAKRLGFSFYISPLKSVGHMMISKMGEDINDFGLHEITIKTLYDKTDRR